MSKSSNFNNFWGNYYSNCYQYLNHNAYLKIYKSYKDTPKKWRTHSWRSKHKVILSTPKDNGAFRIHNIDQFQFVKGSHNQLQNYTYILYNHLPSNMHIFRFSKSFPVTFNALKFPPFPGTLWIYTWISYLEQLS